MDPGNGEKRTRQTVRVHVRKVKQREKLVGTGNNSLNINMKRHRIKKVLRDPNKEKQSV